jgi:hypothetical protein
VFNLFSDGAAKVMIRGLQLPAFRPGRQMHSDVMQWLLEKETLHLPLWTTFSSNFPRIGV